MAANSHRRRSACPRRSGRRGHRDGTVLAEETPHRGAGPRTPMITERLTGGTAGPRVTEPGHQPHLQSAATTRQRPPAHQVSATTACRRRPGRVGGPGPRLADGAPGGRPGVRREPLIGDALRVLGIDGAVRRPLEDDHRGYRRNGDHGGRGGSAPHGEDGVGRAGRGPVRRRGVHADSGKHLRVRCRQHDGHRSTGRKAGDVHPARVDTPRRGFGGHPAHDPGENCRFALRPKLVRRAEPVPAPLWVVRRGLFRIHHDESVLVGQLVEPRAGGEIHRRLSAPMQGEQQRSAGGAAQPERDVYAVTPGTSQAGVAKLTPRAAPGPAVFRRLLPCRIGRNPCPLDGGLRGPGLGGSGEHLTAGTLTLGRADRRLRDRAGRGMSAFMKADPGARLVRRRGTSSFRSVGLPVMKEAFQQRITVGVVPPMVLVPGVWQADQPRSRRQGAGSRTLAAISREKAGRSPPRVCCTRKCFRRVRMPSQWIR